MTNETPPIRFLGQAVVSGAIHIETGLHIGAGKDAVEIGGIDSPVVKTPSGDPYIPGSSLKGKLRTLMEWGLRRVEASGKPWSGGGAPEESDPILRIFGASADAREWKAGPTRLMMRDAPLDADWRNEMLEAGRELTEDKTEVTIDRIAGKVGSAGPRHMERVPPGARFGFRLSFRLFDTGDGGARDRECLAWLIQALDLLEQDALGGSGSRGYGQVRFENLVLRGPEGREVRLDGNEHGFRGHPFSDKAPAVAIMRAVEEALAGPVETGG